MFEVFNLFLEDDEGAVTVDWVVLTAAVVAVGLIVIPIITPGLTSLASTVGSDIRAATLF